MTIQWNQSLSNIQTLGDATDSGFSSTFTADELQNILPGKQLSARLGTYCNNLHSVVESMQI